jgi:hypothetical protein
MSVFRPSPSDRQAAGWKVALCLALLSTVLKVLLLLFPSKHVSPAWVFPEEQHRGNIAREVVDGPLLPVQDYQHSPNVGGSVVVGLMAVPFLAVLGDSIASVRAVPILFNLVSVFLLVILLDRFVSRRAAWIGGVLFAFAPPGYSLVSITAFGTHLENNAFTLLALLLFLNLHRLGTSGDARAWIGTRYVGSEPRSGETRTAVALGFVCGFALYFGYFFAVALIAMLAFEWLHDKLFWLRRWFRFALFGFAAGFAPWILYNLAGNFRGLAIYDQPITKRLSPFNIAGEGLDRFTQFFADLLPGSFFFRGLPREAQPFAAWLAAAGLLALVALCAWQARASIVQAVRALVSLRQRPRDLGTPFLFLLYVPVYLLAFMAADMGLGPVKSGIAHDGRYFAPLYPFLCLIAACALDRLADRFRNGRWIARAVPAGLAALFVAGTLAVCDASRGGEALRTPGTSQEQLARWMAWTWRTDVRRLDRVVDRLQTSRPPAIADGMIFTLAQGLKWGMRTQDRTTEKGKAAWHRNAAALHFLRDRVADAYKPYCEMPAPGEPIYSYKDRALFWASYRHRARAARVREPLALATP